MIKESADFIRARIAGRNPDILMILGSGLGSLADMIEDKVIIPYKEIPHFKASTAIGHAGMLICGYLEGKCVLAMQGRMHYYEGYSMREITYPIKVAAQLGVSKMIITNASGGINCDFNVGDIMLISDHIKIMGDSPLRKIEGEQVTFHDMSFAYSPKLRLLAHKAAENCEISLREGVYFYALGPQYETPAEIRAMRALGADAVGMSTAPEVIVAVNEDIEVLGFSLITNMAAGILPQPLSSDEVIEAANAARERFSALIRECLRTMEV